MFFASAVSRYLRSVLLLLAIGSLSSGCAGLNPKAPQVVPVLQTEPDVIRDEHESYQLQSGGRVYEIDESGQMAQSPARIYKGVTRLGSLLLVTEPSVLSLTNGLRETGYHLAKNMRTGKPAVVTGQVVVKFKPDVDGEVIGRVYNLPMASNLLETGYVIYQTVNVNHLSTVIKLMKADSRVANAYAEVIQLRPTPRNH